jgi:hypothetical protein
MDSTCAAVRNSNLAFTFPVSLGVPEHYFGKHLAVKTKGARLHEI